jgi:hypothetical protein
MGLKCSPDIAQSTTESILSGINDADVYIDEVGAFSKDWDHHVQLLSLTPYIIYVNMALP